MLAHSFNSQSLDLKLTDNEIHVWFAALDQPESEHHRFMETLTIDEKLRAASFHFPDDRKRFIARHGILRTILGCYLGVEAVELRFHTEKNGKPAISETFGKGTIHFNLSHSDGTALFAFALNHEIGVDVEHIRDISELEDIVERFFTAREKSFFRTVPRDERRFAFFNHWICKEAFIKAIGEGFSWPLDKIDVSLYPDDEDPAIAVEGVPGKESDWSIRTFSPARGYVGALAVNSKCFTLKCFNWMPNGS